MTHTTSPNNDVITLTEDEARALNDFIAKKWSAWRSTAEMFLSGDEVDELERKLANA